MRRKKLTAAVLFLVICSWLIPATSALRRDANSTYATYVTSSNWAGVIGSTVSGMATNVQATFAVPSLYCTNSPAQFAMWVGLDDSPIDLEQIGVSGLCRGGVASYWAWYEFLPYNSVVLPSIDANVGDMLHVQVSYLGQQFNLTINDLTQHQAVVVFGSSQVHSLTSAECVIERSGLPPNMTPLADFRQAQFQNCTVNMPLFESWVVSHQIVDIANQYGTSLTSTTDVNGVITIKWLLGN